MPTTTRYLAILAVLGCCVFAAMWSLANLVEPAPRRIVVSVPVEDKLR